MVIYFLRHADAEADQGSDFNRKLTSKGLAQAEKVAKFCVRNGLLPDVILSSPVVRARQTAEILSQSTGMTPTLVDWLACGMEPRTLLQEIKAFKDKIHIFLVGHEPDFSSSIAALIGHPDANAIMVKKSSLTAVDMAWIESGSGSIQFSIPVHLM
jgi:phosphohistidine phosphatase SixA